MRVKQPIEGRQLDRYRLWVASLISAVTWVSTVAMYPADIRVRAEGTNTLLRIEGNHSDDWHIEVSTNFLTWTPLTNFGTLISGNRGTNAPWRSLGTNSAPLQFFRALKTGGLYDPALFRVVNIVFTQANWPTLLTSGRTFETNTGCTVFLDNGATNFTVGARYKGNTSFSLGGNKKSINLEFDWYDTNANLMTYQTVNLNNAAADETIMREALYFGVMHQYTPCPKGAMCRVFINGGFWGVYALIQQENTQLIKEYFPGANGDRWRSPNISGGGFTSSNSAFGYFGTNMSGYTGRYELRTDNSPTTVAWTRLINAITTLNATPAITLRDVLEDTWAVDNWLWFLAIENIFTDDDSYWNKGADFAFYYEPESGRMHPLEHDGNEAFQAGDSSLSPLVGYNATGGNATLNNRPLLYRLLAVDELRQRYLAHMRTVLQEYYNPTTLTPIIDAFHLLSVNAIIADTNKNFTMSAYTNDLIAVRTYVTNRYNYLTTHVELIPLQPNIVSVEGPLVPPKPTEIPTITAEVNGPNGIDSVWLYYRDKPYGRFISMQMFDDGAHGDYAPGDRIFGAGTTNFPAGNKIHYYVEARSANAARAARFSPARAEAETYYYRVGLASATNTSVVINEFMASNTGTLADPQGEFDDWIEIHNITDRDLDLTGLYLTDDPNNPRKWPFPAGTTISSEGFLLVWADENGLATPGLHANFKLAASGEQILLIDTDARLNGVLDSITFGPQTTDISYGRSHFNADLWMPMTPTPGTGNE